MNPGKTHLISSLQPQRLNDVQQQLFSQFLARHEGRMQSPDIAQLTEAAQEDLRAAYKAFARLLERHAAVVVWEEEYVEEAV